MHCTWITLDRIHFILKINYIINEIHKQKKLTNLLTPSDTRVTNGNKSLDTGATQTNNRRRGNKKKTKDDLIRLHNN